MSKLTLGEALLKFKETELKVVKDSKNSFYANSEYADINNVLRTIQPSLNELGIVIVQSVQVTDFGDVLNTIVGISDNNVRRKAFAKLTLILYIVNLNIPESSIKLLIVGFIIYIIKIFIY